MEVEHGYNGIRKWRWQRLRSRVGDAHISSSSGGNSRIVNSVGGERLVVVAMVGATVVVVAVERWWW